MTVKVRVRVSVRAGAVCYTCMATLTMAALAMATLAMATLTMAVPARGRG